MSDAGGDFGQLVAALPQGIEVHREDVFSKAKRFGLAKLNARRAEWLNAAAPILRALLAPGETVHVVSRAIANHAVEHMTMGAWAYLINQTLLIATDRRIVLIHTDTKLRPKSYVNQFPKAAIKKIGGTLGSTSFVTAKGSWRINGVPAADRKTLQRLFPASSEARGSLQRLCPSCFHVAEQWVPRCERCGVEFKSARTALLRSLLLPGLGDFYLGHRGLAVLEMIGALVVWIIAISLVAHGDPIGYAAGAAVLLFSNGLDAAVTGWQAKKGLMSGDGRLPSAVTGARAVQPALGVRNPG